MTRTPELELEIQPLRRQLFVLARKMWMLEGSRGSLFAYVRDSLYEESMAKSLGYQLRASEMVGVTKQSVNLAVHRLGIPYTRH